MLRILALFTLASTLIVGCRGPYRDTCLYQRTGGTKPIVALLPVLTSSEMEAISDISWDISQELTEEIRRRFFDSSRLYLLEGTGNKQLAKELNNNNLKVLSDLRIENVGASQFVVVTELVNEKVTPYRVGANEIGDAGAQLELDLRLRVIDVREKSPKVVFQELLHHNHFIPRAYLHCDYEKAAWGTETYERTPLGMAHAQLAREVVSRVEIYIQTMR